MIFVNGTPFLEDSFSSSSKEIDTLDALLKHNVLISASDSFKAIAERKFSVPKEVNSENSKKEKCVYLFQREFATVHNSLVHYVGTDEATTCVALAIWNPSNGMTSVAHMDSSKVVDVGLGQMISKFVDFTFDDDLHVHIVGAFEDFSPKDDNDRSNSKDGYSIPLCSKIVQTLMTRRERFHLKTLCVLSHNTRRDSQGTPYPLFTGFVVETSTGSVIPAQFDSTSRGPDDMVRRVRITSAYEDHKWDRKLLETYDTETDTFKIEPVRWTRNQALIARLLLTLPDSELLRQSSTSPSAESPDFVETERRKWEYLIRNPHYKETFPMNQARVFERTSNGDWKSVITNRKVGTIWRDLLCKNPRSSLEHD